MAVSQFAMPELHGSFSSFFESLWDRPSRVTTGENNLRCFVFVTCIDDFGMVNGKIAIMRAPRFDHGVWRPKNQKTVLNLPANLDSSSRKQGCIAYW